MKTGGLLMKLSAINTKAVFKAFAQTVTVVSVLAAAGQAMAAPKAAAKKDPARDVIITLTNGRTSPVIFFTVIGADSQGQEDNLLKDALAPGKSVKVKAKGLKGCSFGIAADLEDGSSSEATGVNLCKDATVKLVD
jgi:hypothetical protein